MRCEMPVACDDVRQCEMTWRVDSDTEPQLRQRSRIMCAEPTAFRMQCWSILRDEHLSYNVQ